MKFLENKYKRWYDNIIKSAKNRNIDGYVEKHHILPKSLGGSNDTNNLVVLTAREHFLCHLLLTRFIIGEDKRLMRFALGKFIQNSPNQQRKFNSWEYKKIRENISIGRKGKLHSDESKKKMSDAAKGRIPWNKGKSVDPCTAERKMLLSNYWKGKPKSAVHSENISKGKLGHTVGMTGKTHSEDTKIKISNKMKGPRGPQERIEKCIKCGNINVTYRHIKFCKN